MPAAKKAELIQIVSIIDNATVLDTLRNAVLPTPPNHNPLMATPSPAAPPGGHADGVSDPGPAMRCPCGFGSCKT